MPTENDLILVPRFHEPAPTEEDRRRMMERELAYSAGLMGILG